MLNTDVPRVIGTPEITPEGERLKPVGKVPAVSDQTPPDAEDDTRVCEYDAPANPAGRFGRVSIFKADGWAQAAQLMSIRPVARRTGFIVRYLQLPIVFTTST